MFVPTVCFDTFPASHYHPRYRKTSTTVFEAQTSFWSREKPGQGEWRGPSLVLQVTHTAHQSFPKCGVGWPPQVGAQEQFLCPGLGCCGSDPTPSGRGLLDLDSKVGLAQPALSWPWWIAETDLEICHSSLLLLQMLQQRPVLHLHTCVRHSHLTSLPMSRQHSRA